MAPDWLKPNFNSLEAVQKSLFFLDHLHFNVLKGYYEILAKVHKKYSTYCAFNIPVIRKKKRKCFISVTPQLKGYLECCKYIIGKYFGPRSTKQGYILRKKIVPKTHKEVNKTARQKQVSETTA